MGKKAQFRIHKDKLLLQVEDIDDKECEYSVVSMTPRHDRKSSETASSKQDILALSNSSGATGLGLNSSDTTASPSANVNEITLP
jgi:hypothetical protein